MKESVMLLSWLRRQVSPAPKTSRRRVHRRRPVPLGCERLDERCLPSVFTVTTTADTGAGSLRQALLDANANPGLDTIAFRIASGVQTIRPASVLPSVTDPVVIDGTTQPGWTNNPIIVLDGSGLGPVSGSTQTYGLDIIASGC